MFHVPPAVFPSVPEQEKYEEMFIGENPPLLPRHGSAQIIEDKPLVTPKVMANKAASQVQRTGPNGMIIRGMTFYKSEPEPMVGDDGEPGENCKCEPLVRLKVRVEKAALCGFYLSIHHCETR